jgi:mannose-6-phosphate isomerase-like protein (cupin superfamily)
MSVNPTAGDLRLLAETNTWYRRVLFTSGVPPAVPDGTAIQTVLMAISDYVGWEKHDENTQHFLVVSGSGTVFRGSESEKSRSPQFSVKAGDAFFVLPKQWHDIENTSANGAQLKLVTSYYPPHHPHDRHQRTRTDAEAEERAEAAQ